MPLRVRGCLHRTFAWPPIERSSPHTQRFGYVDCRRAGREQLAASIELCPGQLRIAATLAPAGAGTRLAHVPGCLTALCAFSGLALDAVGPHGSPRARALATGPRPSPNIRFNLLDAHQRDVHRTCLHRHRRPELAAPYSGDTRPPHAVRQVPEVSSSIEKCLRALGANERRRVY
jgi:hypothetical protein